MYDDSHIVLLAINLLEADGSCNDKLRAFSHEAVKSEWLSEKQNREDVAKFQ